MEAVGNTFPILLLKCFQINRNLAKSAPRNLPGVLSGTFQKCSHEPGQKCSQAPAKSAHMNPAKSALRHLSRVFLGLGVRKIRIHVFKSIFKF